jgi:cytochrome o ubiquinol oxidase subunit II
MRRRTLKAPPAGTRHSVSIGVLLAVLFLAGCSDSRLTFLDPHGPVAAAQRAHLIAVVLMVMIVVLPVLVLTPWFAWRYRRRNASTPYRPHWSFSWPLEIAIWGIPMAIVAVLSVWLWQGTHALDPYAPLPSDKEPLRVEVVGYDWKWLFIYPDYGIASFGRLAFPADRPLAIDLTSATVMQSFFIPALGSQIYAMAGMVTHLNLKADAPGHFLGENTQYNGDGFQEQRFSATAMTLADFKAWSAHVKASGIPLTPATYRVIAQRSTVANMRKALAAGDMPPGTVYFTDVPPDLFHDIVQAFHGRPFNGMALSERAAPPGTASPPSGPQPE